MVCRQLKRDIILGADFGKNNCAGVEWTTKRTRVLSLNGIPAIEVEENELGLPVTAAFHVKVKGTTVCFKLTYMEIQKAPTSYQLTVNSWKRIQTYFNMKFR